MNNFFGALYLQKMLPEALEKRFKELHGKLHKADGMLIFLDAISSLEPTPASPWFVSQLHF